MLKFFQRTKKNSNNSSNSNNSNNSKKIELFAQSIEKKLDLIFKELYELKTDVSLLKTDVSELKTDVSELKTDVSVLKNDLSLLKTNFYDLKKNYDRYTKQDSDFQEARINIFIKALLQHNNNASIITQLTIKNLYGPYGNNRLTDCDGLLLQTSQQYSMPKIQDEMLNRVNKNFKESLKENISQINKYFVNSNIILVEAKRSGSKEKVDNKIKQLYELINIIGDLVKFSKLSNTTSGFKNFLNELNEQSGLTFEELQNFNVKCIFASDDISPELRKYIININNGISSEEYYMVCYELYKSDKYAVNLVEEIRKNTRIGKDVKILLSKVKTILQLKDIFDNYLKEYNIKDISNYFIPYEDMELYFDTMRGRIGVVQFNTAYFPELFHFTSMNNTQFNSI